MLTIPQDLSDKRILVTNDDGVHAEGIEILECIARQLSDDVWVVAPETEQSGAGHSLTLHLPLRVREINARRFAVNGTPTDCVLLAGKEIISHDKPIDLVLSGINRGMNVAEDVTYSGTIAAAMEGTLLDIPSVAISQAVPAEGEVRWQTAEHYALHVLRQLQGFSWAKGKLLSINTPDCSVEDVKGIRMATQGRRKIAEALDKRHDPKGRPYFWLGGTGYDKAEDIAGTDHTLLKEGYVTLSPLCLDLTHHETLSALHAHFEQKESNA